ncbi:MAG: type VI secretion system membrane subunit TssM [Polyangiaceae bacterium]|nr:type VI secretion system membrane subunit TssM [Polyangiaceae bacterium]
MWLWILSALVVALVWAGWFFLRPDPRVANTPGADIFPIWIPIAVTVGVILLLVGIWLFRRIRAARAARALEKAIAQQAQEQALAAKPEQRAEIQALYQQIQAGIDALKRSKLGGGKRGADALYSLPWYVMVGPPGAGKTTALRHSGLVFPYLDPEGGGVRGVGGTRNCDWWFTNEAILLDTAGRYMTEAEDHDEWMAFLEQLLKYRPEKPLNGVVVAVSISELLDATDDNIQQMGKKLRSRIDEMQSTLHMALPVYVMFTKADLISGFTEFFGDLKKSERGQPFGATIKLDQPKTDPGKVFDAEFDLIVENVHERTLRRMALERNREVKEKVYQFPLEFAAVKQNLSQLLQAAFAPGAGEQPTPLLRGFYFTSGTQEGRPLDRVVGAMARAFGLRPAAEPEPERSETKSYFLRDVFMNIMFPDQDLAVRSAAVIRRERMKRLLVAAVAALIGLLFIIPAIVSFVNNRALVAQTRSVTEEAKPLLLWTADGGDAAEKVEKLDLLRQHLELLDKYEQEGAPMSHRWGMYQGDTLFDPTLAEYNEILKKGFVNPTRERLEKKLEAASGAKYLEDYNYLKTYLLLSDPVHLQELADWEADRLTNIWAEILIPTTQLNEAELKLKIRPHVAYYVDLLRRGAVKAEPPLKTGLVEQVRERLRRVGETTRYYDQFVTALIDQKYDEGGPATRDNLKYPPVSLNEMFTDRPEVLTKVTSGLKQRTGKWYEVLGPYTAKGHEQVMASLLEGFKLLEREQWVLPFTDEEKKQGDRIQKSLDRVRQDYEAEYIRQWVNFFRDIEVAVPPNNREAIEEFRVLATPDWPYLRLLRTLSDHTQFDDPRNQPPAEAASSDGGVLDQIQTRIERRVDSRLRTPGAAKVLKGMLGAKGGPGERLDPIQEKFRSMVQFGIAPPPPETQEGTEAPPPPSQANPPSLGKYIEQLEGLAGEMGTIEDGPASADTKRAREKFEDAVRVTQGLLLDMDPTGQDLMEPLLMNPLRQGYKAVVRSAGGAASGLWEVVVWPHYREKIKDRYPFNLLSSRDASFEDAVAFFKPKDGVLWGFYGQYLDPFHEKVGHEFVPRGYMESRPKPARAFTPFNPNMYNCLRRADEITDALFGTGGEMPKVVFNINLKTVSPIVSDVVFEIDGQRRVYRNEKEFWYQFTWPGEKQTGAKIQVRGAGGLDEEISRDGPWGIFRLFEAGTTTAQKDSDEMFTVTWQMTAPPVTVTMEVRPTRGNHPFPMSFFRAMNCPPSIGDTFGPPKG